MKKVATRPLGTTMVDLRWFTEDAEIAAMDLIKVSRTYSDKSSSLYSGGTASLSSSSEDSEGSNQVAPLVLAPVVFKAGDWSPSSTCRQRRLSHAIVTNEKAKHRFLIGRPRMLYPGLSRLPSSIQTETSLGPKANEKTPVVSRTPKSIQYDYTSHPAPLRRDAWEAVAASHYHVRGKDYLRDGQKYPSEESVFRLLTVDLVKVDAPMVTGLAQQPGERIQLALAREKSTRQRELPEFVFCVNLSLPGRSHYHWVAYFGVDDASVLKDQDTPLGRLAKPFFFGESDAYRDSHFKLIPRVVQGNYLVRKAVGSKPSLLGQKLKCHYIRTDRFLEIVVDIGSESLAQRILKLALGYAKTLQVDMMFLLEGRGEETLPERMLAGVRVKHLDFVNRDGQRTLMPAVAADGDSAAPQELKSSLSTTSTCGSF